MNFKIQNGHINNLSIRVKLTLVTLLLIILSITATKIYDYSFRVPEIEERMKTEQLNNAMLTASKLETEISKTVSTLEMAANNTSFISNDKDTLVNALLSIKRSNQIFSAVFLADESLNRINEKGELSSLANREYMQEVKKTKETVISKEVIISQSTNKPAIMIATPIKIIGSPERYLGISINIDNFQKIIDETQKSDSNYSFAFDGKDGLMFVHPIKEYVGSLKLINPDEKDKSKVATELQQMAKEAILGHSGTQIYSFNSSKIIAAYANIPGTSFGVATRMNYEDAMEPIRKERNSAIIITLITSVIGAIVTIIFSKFIADPIKSIANQANIIESGDFTKSINVNINSEDEVGQLQKSFKNMAIMLKSTMEQIEQAVTHISSSSEILEVGAENNSKAAVQVAETIVEIASGANDQANAINNTVEIFKEIDHEINEIARNTSDVALLSKESSNKAIDGEKTISHAIDTIKNINEIVQDTSNVIKNLGNSSDQISKIVDTISNIASQTNLLALNASIEAARAGEQGRGFSVVADEIRKLANQSKESVSGISQIIRDVQSQTKYAIDRMSESADIVSTGQDVVLIAGESFKIIKNRISDVNQAVQEITSTIQQLSMSSNNVITSIEKVREISKETASNTQTIAAAAEEQSASMEEIASSAESLAQLSNELETSIKNYKF